MTKDAITIHFHGNYTTFLTLAVDLGNEIMFILLSGYIAAFIIKRLTPNYDTSDYKATSRLATLYSIPAAVILISISVRLLNT